jgi:tetratricopeptide (TPR) repeat protein
VNEADVQAVNNEASALMKRGIALLDEGSHDAVAEALGLFERALELRKRLPIESAPLLRFGLAACWLNRADALVRLGGEDRLSAAIRSYDAGIILLRDLSLAEDARFPRRLAIAHQNRGLALQALGPAHAAEAIGAFTDAVAILDDEAAAPIPDRHHLLAVVCVNLANARASVESAGWETDARREALRAIALAADLEERDADAAEVGLKARHVLCRTVAARLSQTAPNQTMSGQTMPDDVHEATDAVDEGLDLARRWEQKGVARFRGVACDLFRFGARVYAVYQPHFLDEFVLENLDPAHSSAAYVGSAEMRMAAEEARGLLRERSG